MSSFRLKSCGRRGMMCMCTWGTLCPASVPSCNAIVNEVPPKCRCSAGAILWTVAHKSADSASVNSTRRAVTRRDSTRQWPACLRLVCTQRETWARTHARTGLDGLLVHYGYRMRGEVKGFGPRAAPRTESEGHHFDGATGSHFLRLSTPLYERTHCLQYSATI